jgi:hypothetical protein
VSVVVVTTISCEAVILRCSSCQAEVAVASTTSAGSFCRSCDGTMLLDRRCGAGFSLQHDGLLIRCIAENKDGWRCEDRGGRDFCSDHAHLANPARVEKPTPQAIRDA